MFTGDSVHTLHHAYLLGYSTVLPIVRDTCRAICRVLKDEHMKVIFMFNVLVNSVNYFLILVWACYFESPLHICDSILY